MLVCPALRPTSPVPAHAAGVSSSAMARNVKPRCLITGLLSRPPSSVDLGRRRPGARGEIAPAGHGGGGDIRWERPDRDTGPHSGLHPALPPAGSGILHSMVASGTVARTLPLPRRYQE